MGWTASGRTMVHWWSQRERGAVVSAWNIAHNLGGGLLGPLFLLGMHRLGDWAGIPGTLLCGRISGRLFRGSRGATGVVVVLLVRAAAAAVALLLVSVLGDGPGRGH